ncbi:MAG TPA: hypothetical protein VMB72_11715 [Acidimicrobiales bacterium]|nr:hypothetical protein [Acidimicrobiales bacterium]
MGAVLVSTALGLVAFASGAEGTAGSVLPSPTTTAPVPQASADALPVQAPSVAPATTAPPSTPAASAQVQAQIPPAQTVPSDDISSENGSLYLDGAPYQFVGVNAYEIASDWGVNGSCGPMESDAQLDQLFGSLPPNSLVRFWAWQGSAAINVTTHQLDWGPLDRVFDIAAQYHQRLVVVLAGQSGACDDGVWKDPSWYDGGFMDVHDAGGLTPLSYWDYMQDVVNRYKSSPALGMWEPVSEPEASTCPPQYQPAACGDHQTCPDELVAEAALRYFFDAVGSAIHTLDPDHLVESGTIGSGQCGASGPNYANLSASPGIDVLSYHDYSGATSLPGDAWNGLALRIGEASAMHKPIIVGEVGLLADPGGADQGCATPGQRAQQFAAKASTQLAAGVSGLLVWDWMPSAPTTCSYDTYPGDPLMADVAAGPSA